MDTGGLAQMTYNNNMSLNTSSLGVPGSGFASRGKGSHIKRLSVPHPPPRLDQRDDHPNSVSTPRTSRSHLLAGLRTAPKQPTTPSTAPLMQEHRNQNGFGGMQNYGGHHNAYMAGVPQTATGVSFNHSKTYNNGNAAQAYNQLYSLPEHVLAPPTLDHILEESGEPIDESLYAELVSTNLYLAAQQQRLQQQLASVTAAAQQIQAFHLGTPVHSTHVHAHQQQHKHQQQQQQQLFSPLNNMGFYQQQAQSMQPVVQAVPGKPGVFSVYNPMTGQQNFVVDNSVYDDAPLSAAPTAGHYEDQIRSPVEAHSNTNGHFQGHLNGASNGNTQSMYRTQARVSPPPMDSRQSPVRSHPSSMPSTRNPTPPREAQVQFQSQPQQVSRQSPPLQSPAPGLKRDHKKSLSLAVKLINETTRSTSTGSSTPKSAMFPQTPVSAGPGTFGPGQARAGEHAIRQPRGPPPLEELIAKPTTKHEGSRNFATRQRRKAVSSLVRARLERNTSTSTSNGNSQASTGGSVTPSSEHGNEDNGEGDFTFSPSDGDADSSSSLSGRRSLGSLRAAANGAIGSERRHGNGANNNLGELDSGRRMMPMMVLSNAEKRKSTLM